MSTPKILDPTELLLCYRYRRSSTMMTRLPLTSSLEYRRHKWVLVQRHWLKMEDFERKNMFEAGPRLKPER